MHYTGDVVLQTGGQLHFITGNMEFEDNVLRLEQQLAGDLEQVTAHEAVIKVNTLLVSFLR